MLRISVIELFLRALPEALLCVFACYAFSKQALDKSRFILSSILFSITIYGIRLLPISFGVHTILGLILLIIFAVIINKIELIKAVSSVVITTLLQFVCEMINVVIIQYVLKIDLNKAFGQPMLKTLLGLPSLIIFGCVVGWYYFRYSKNKQLRYR